MITGREAAVRAGRCGDKPGNRNMSGAWQRFKSGEGVFVRKNSQQTSQQSSSSTGADWSGRLEVPCEP
jgi:hypothetical protein